MPLPLPCCPKTRVLVALLAYGLIAISGRSQSALDPFPQVTGESLSGKPLSLPAGNAVILCIGFSHSSQSHLKDWVDQARKRFNNDPHIAIYSIAVLEDAPRFVRPMAVHGMKNDTPVDERDRFIVVYSNEKALKHAVRFVSPSDAYIVLLDRAGNIAWHFHGDASQNAMTELSNRVRTILSNGR
ncbi:MAG: hypothetical protein M3Y72_15235 [Acidobacteriota bacterium]|nr:hypothetical protein [Acidobacteriota bacterium]